MRDMIESYQADAELLARHWSVSGDSEAELARDILVLADGHCLRDQALEVCSRVRVSEEQDYRATSLETLRQMEVLHRLGVVVMQGYLFSRPLPVEAFEAFMA